MFLYKFIQQLLTLNQLLLLANAVYFIGVICNNLIYVCEDDMTWKIFISLAGVQVYIDFHDFSLANKDEFKPEL